MKKTRFLTVAAASGAALLIGPALAQSANGVLQTARIDSRFEGNDNYALDDDSPGNAFLWTNTLTFGLDSRTGTDELTSRVSGDLRYADLPVIGSDTSLDNGTVRLNYGREIDDNSLGLNLFFNDADIEFSDPLRTLDENGDFDDTRGEGRRTLLTAAFNTEINADGPLRFGLEGSTRNIDYRDTTDPDLVDEQRYRVGALTGFRVTDTTELVLDGSFSQETQENDELDRTTSDIGISIDQTVTPRLELDARVGYQRVDAERAGEDDVNQEGAIGSLSMIYDMPNGVITSTARSRLTENGTRNEILFGREMDLPTGSIAGTFGLSNSNTTDIRPILSLNYGITRPSTTLDLGMRQVVFVDDDGDDILNFSMNAAYSHEITRVSNVSLSALAARRQTLSNADDPDDVTRLTLTAQYAHRLTPDWSLSSGVTHRSRLEDNGEDAYSNSVFLTLSREFSARR